MASRKEFDWVGENLANPDFTNTDFKETGINIDNTSIGPENIYTSNPQIRALPEFQTNGKFDESKFHQKYVELAASYNKLSKNTYYDDLKNQGRIFAENNVFVSPEERQQSPAAFMTLINNPDHISYGITGIDKAGPRTKTPMELAEMNKIFDPKTGEFTDYTAEESLFKDFWRPKIMATYDMNVDINGNPTEDPTKIAHFKGEYKLDENGEYYSEFADGRSTYGKEVISHWNILTKENSWINKYDPFDSDDIKKSTIGSIARNALKILPLLPFAPLTTIAPYYAAASIGINLVDALGTLGKLVFGSENTNLNKITAFTEQFNQTTSEEGLTSTFSLENVINMVGDTFMFLKSQRILAEQAPRIFMNNAYELKQNTNKAIEKLAASYMKEAEPAIKAKYGTLETLTDPAKLSREMVAEIETLRKAAASKAIGAVNNQIENFNKLGRQISTSMMAITFGLHTYGTAKAQGVSDTAATALTLGAIAGQYGLLSSHIGQKIFPEATIQKQQLKKAIQEWGDSLKLKNETKSIADSLNSKATEVQKVKEVKSLMQKGKELADRIWGVNGSLYGTVGANTVATGIEMASFTMLDDVIASIYNLGAWLSGDSNRMQAWDNIANRYGSALLGGAIAGAISAPEIYRAKQNIDNMTKHQAYELLAYMINENKTSDIIKEIDRNVWGDPNLSTQKVAETVLDNGEIEAIYGSASPGESQNDEAKRIMKQTIYDMENILTTYGAKIDSDSLLNVLINNNDAVKDIRFALLKDSNVAQMYIKEYVQNQVDIYTLAKKLRSGLTDAQIRAVDKEEAQLDKLPENLKDTAAKTEDTAADLGIKGDLQKALKKNAEYLNGKRSADFIEEAIFEMQQGINSPFYDAAFIKFIDQKAKEAGKNGYEDLDLPAKQKYAKEFYYTNTGQQGVDNLRLAFHIFKLGNEIGSPALNKIKETNLPDKVKNIKLLVEDLKNFIRNELYFNKINPYESPVASPYKLNAINRPENKLRTDFTNKAETKLYEDALHLLNTLLDHYSRDGKISEQSKKAIETVQNFYINWGKHYAFVEQLKERVNNRKKEHDNWEKAKQKAQESGEEFTEEEPVLYILDKAFIREQLEESKASKEALGLEGDFEDTFLKIINDAERVIKEESKRIKTTYGNNEIPEQEFTKINSLYGLLETILDPKAFDSNNYISVVGEPSTFSDSIQRMLEGLQLHTIGESLSDDIIDSLSGAGYLDSETKTLLTIFLNRLKEGLKNRVGDNDTLIINGAKNVVPKGKTLHRFNPLQALSLVSEDFVEVGKTLDTLIKRPRNKDLFGKFRQATNRLKDFSTDGILSVADTLKEHLGFKGHSVSEIIQMLDVTIQNQTDNISTLLNTTRTNVKEFILSPTALAEIDDAILILQIVRSNTIAANNVVSSAENAIGFNPTVNKIRNLTGDKKLVVLENGQVIDTVQDISDLIYKLLYWKQVAANAMRLRTELTDQADLGFKINVYDQVINKISILKSLGWKNVEQFDSAVGALQTLSDLRQKERNVRIIKQSDETKEAITKEFISFQIALHDLLKANEDIINNPEQLAKFINSDNFKINKQFKSITKEDILDDDVALLHFIAGVGAIDPKVFYSNLAESMSGRKLPITVQNTWKYQAIAFSFAKDYINKFNKALEYSFKEKISDLNSTDSEKQKEAQIKFVKAFLGRTINPYRSHVMLIESGPGSGKTGGYLPELINLIFKMDPDFNVEKDLWITAPEDLVAAKQGGSITKPAEDIRKEIGAKETKVLTRELLLRTILKDFDKYNAEFEIKNGKVNPVDETGKAKVFDVDINTGRLIFDHELNDAVSELPKIIILDEISDYSSFDLDIIQDFAEKHNITVLASGDFTQSGVYGNIQTKLGDEILPSLVRPTAGEFGSRSFKSQISFRTTNTQSDNNNNVIRPYFESYIEYARNGGNENLLPKEELVLGHYFNNKTGDLFGTYITDASDTLSDELKEYLDGIYKSIQNNPDKNVTLLYSDVNSPIYKYIISKSGKDYDWTLKTDFRQDTVLKGVENTYYIIDLDPNIHTASLMTATKEEKAQVWEEAERVAREYYTALTRQKQGAIVVDRFSDKLPNFKMISKPSDENTSEISLSLEFIQKRSARLSEVLKTMFPEVVPVNLKIGQPIETPQQNQGSGEASEDDYTHKSLGLGNNYQVEDGEEYNYADVETDAQHSRRIQAEEDGERRAAVFSNDGSSFEYVSPTTRQGNPIQNKIPNDQIRGVINTFNAAYTGYNSEGKLIPTRASGSFGRRDSAYGLRHMMDLGYIPDIFRIKGIDINELTNPQKSGTIQDVQDLLDQALAICVTYGNNEAMRELSNLFGLNGVPNKVMRWVFTSKIENQTEYPPTFVGDKFVQNFDTEKGFNAVGYGEKNNKIPRKILSLVIGTDDGTNRDVLISLPVATLPHWATVLETNSTLMNSVIGAEYRKICAKYPESKDSHKIDAEMLAYLKQYLVNTTNPILGAGGILKLLEVWRATSYYASYMDPGFELIETDKSQNGNFINLGPFMLTARRGQNYRIPGYEQDQTDPYREDKYKLHDLETLQKRYDVSSLFVAKSNSGEKYVSNSGYTIKSGGYHVLIARKGMFRVNNMLDEEAMFRALNKQLENPGETNGEVKIVQVRPPRATVKEFLESEYELLFNSVDPTTRERQDIGNHFTVYRVLQKLFENYDENGTTPFNKTVNSVINFSGAKASLKNVREDVLRLTYLEGQIDPSRKAKLGKIYTIAEQELSNDIKTSVKNSITAGQDYVQALSIALRETSKSSRHWTVRNQMRYFLQYLAHHEKLELSNVEGEVKEIKDFLEGELSKYSILYNVTFNKPKEGEVAHSVQIKYKNSDQSAQFQFYKVNTDSESGQFGRGKYKYKDKSFQFATQIINGPLYGNVTSIVDAILLSFNKVVYPKGNPTVQSKHTVSYRNNDIKTITKVEYFDYDSSSASGLLQGVVNVPEALQGSEYSAIYYGPKKNKFFVITKNSIIKSAIGDLDFSDLRRVTLSRYNEYKDELDADYSNLNEEHSTIFTVSTSEGNKYLVLTKVDDTYIIKDITKKSEEILNPPRQGGESQQTTFNIDKISQSNASRQEKALWSILSEYSFAQSDISAKDFFDVMQAEGETDPIDAIKQELEVNNRYNNTDYTINDLPEKFIEELNSLLDPELRYRREDQRACPF